MKIPNEIKLGGHEIKVEQVAAKDIDSPGEFNSYYDLIRLRFEHDSPESSLSECFLHEIMEAIKAKNNLVIDHTHLTVLSEVLFQVLRDNRLDFGGMSSGVKDGLTNETGYFHLDKTVTIK